MKVEIHLEGYEKGTPFELANAIINHYIGRTYSAYKVSLIELDEISDHIKVFVNHAREAEEQE